MHKREATMKHSSSAQIVAIGNLICNKLLSAKYSVYSSSHEITISWPHLHTIFQLSRSKGSLVEISDSLLHYITTTTSATNSSNNDLSNSLPIMSM
jgi:fructose-1,6-bisphosphatase